MSDVLHGGDPQQEPDLVRGRALPNPGVRGRVSPYEYTVRWREKDAKGQPSSWWEYFEWSCGCPRILSFAEASAYAQEFRDDDCCDYMMNIEVARRPSVEWEPAQDTPQPATTAAPAESP